MNKLATLLTLLIGLGAINANANLVTNGNFATGTLSGWTVDSTSDDPWAVNTSGGGSNTPLPGDGFLAYTGCSGAQCITGSATQQASLSQTLTTVAGQAYTLTFWFYTGGAASPNGTNGEPNELDVLWNGASVDDLGPGGTLGIISAWTEYTVNLTGAETTSTSTTLTFLGRQDSGFDALDSVDVEVASSSGTPEPSTLFLFVGVLPLLAIVRRTVRG